MGVGRLSGVDHVRAGEAGQDVDVLGRLMGSGENLAAILLPLA